MTTVQRMSTLIRQTRLLKKIERSFAREIRKEKNRFILAQADNYKRSRRLSTDLLNEHANNIKAILKKHSARTIRIFSNDVQRNFPSAKSFYNLEKKRDLFALLLLEYSQEFSAQQIKDISQTSYNDLRKVLLAGIQEELTPAQITKQLLGVRSLSTWRANTIARTETHNAATFASKRTAETIANEVGVEIYKKWIPALDERTRFSHAQMINHKAIPMDGKFRVARSTGGFDMMDRPGDPAGSAGNVINCRCILNYEERPDS